MSIIKILNLKKENSSAVRNLAFEEGVKLLNIIVKNTKYPTCIQEYTFVAYKNGFASEALYVFGEGRCFVGNIKQLPSPTESGLRNYLSSYFPFSAEVSHSVQNFDSGKGDRLKQLVIFTETKEEALKAFFKKHNSLSYCNGTSVSFVDTQLQQDYHKYFYQDKGGMGRYAAMGGNMD